MDLGGRTALVTGSSAGIGAAIAEQLAAEGCRVLVHGRHLTTAQPQADRIRAAGGEAVAVAGDLGSEVSTDRFLADVDAHGPVDILIANVGPFAEHTFDEASDDDYRQAFETNVVSVLRCTRALVPAMRERGWGRIVTISTRGATRPLTNMIAYSTAKAAVTNLTGNLAQQLAGTGITANTISPGLIVTPSVRTVFEDRAARQGDHRPFAELEDELVEAYAANPTGRLGRPEDVAAAAVYLASPRADYVNGATLRVDGGLTGTVNP